MNLLSLQQMAAELGEQARKAIADTENLVGDAPKLDAEGHSKLHMTVKRHIKSIRSSLMQLTKANDNAMESRFGAGPTAPKNQSTLDEALANEQDQAEPAGMSDSNIEQFTGTKTPFDEDQGLMTREEQAAVKERIASTRRSSRTTTTPA